MKVGSEKDHSKSEKEESESRCEKEESESETDKQDEQVEEAEGPKWRKPDKGRQVKMIKDRNSKAQKSSVKFLSPYSGLGTWILEA